MAQVFGGFFTIAREGKLELRKFGASPVLAVEQAHRFSSSISDFVSRKAVLMHQPAETWQEGRHTALLYWPLLKLTANQQNRVELYAKISGGSGSIGMHGLVATAAGQSLTGAGCDGTVFSFIQWPPILWIII